ncbi:MAG: citrate/2-methylcitrate synthase [Candidatus Binatia bacterium]|nr:citrate/2-methylcitrate synthase [Candidatus Binatia bacterium]
MDDPQAAPGEPTQLTAHQAATELGISLSTLYAYVSRGLIRSESGPDGRSRRYRTEDVWSLKRRKDHRRDPDKAAEEALHWGLPVLQSSLSLISDGRLYYRGRDVVTLATSCTIEQVAALLWSGSVDEPLSSAEPIDVGQDGALLKKIKAPLTLMEIFQAQLTVAAAHDTSAFDVRPLSVQRTGLNILRLMAATAAGGKPSKRGIAEVLQRKWCPKRPDAVALLDAALVLYADHELNPSTFTARCVASAGATPYGVVLAGLAALQGSKHGGACERAEALLNESSNDRVAHRAVAARLRRGEAMPGFGHPLYPDGDPRGALLMGLVRERCAGSHGVKVASALADAVWDLMGERPTVDFALVTLCRALELPSQAPLGLLAIGRTVGWIAHAIEQYGEGRLIRPRARYTGEPPTS